jgi:DNA-binding beta-propeller fold protein YncE
MSLSTIGAVVRVWPDGSVHPFASGLGSPADIALSAGGGFGEYLYVTDSSTNRIHRVDSSGTSTVFATGFAFTGLGFGDDLAFSVDGNSLFVANGNSLVKIAVVTDPW